MYFTENNICIMKVQELLDFFHAITMLQTQHRPIYNGFLCVTWVHLIEIKEERGGRYHTGGIHQEEGKEGKTTYKESPWTSNFYHFSLIHPQTEPWRTKGLQHHPASPQGSCSIPVYFFCHLDKTSYTSMHCLTMICVSVGLYRTEVASLWVWHV